MVPLIYSLGASFELPMFDEIKTAEGLKGQGVLTKKFGSETSDIVCGVNLCSEIPMNKEFKKRSFSYPSTPLGQYYFGVPINKIICNPGLELILKASNYFPACVKPSNVDRLIEIGWALDESRNSEIIKLNENKIFDEVLSKI